MTNEKIEHIAKEKRTGNSPTDNAFCYGYAQAVEDSLEIFKTWLDDNFPDTYIGEEDIKDHIENFLFNNL